MELADIRLNPSTVHMTAYQKLIWMGVFPSIQALALNHSYQFFSLTHEKPSLKHLNQSSFIETIWYAQCVCVYVHVTARGRFSFHYNMRSSKSMLNLSVSLHCYLTISFAPFNLMVGFHVYQSLKPSIMKLFECSHICVALLIFGQTQMILSG